MSARITFSPEARDLARQAARWWRENRPAARRLFATELRRALLLLAHSPEIGVAYPAAPVSGVRRALLASTRYHVYYTYNVTTNTIEILAVWGGVQERDPFVR
jgi:plasmid stabilization system protein ParE